MNCLHFREVAELREIPAHRFECAYLAICVHILILTTVQFFVIILVFCS